MWLEKKIEEHFPNYMTLKLNSRIRECRLIVDKYNQGQPLTNYQQKQLLSVLRKTNNLEITQEIKDVDKAFMLGNAFAIGLATASMIFPFLVRQFYSIRKWSRYAIMGTIFTGVYCLTIIPFYVPKRILNERLVHQNIHKFKNIKTQEVVNITSSPEP